MINPERVRDGDCTGFGKQYDANLNAPGNPTAQTPVSHQELEHAREPESGGPKNLPLFLTIPRPGFD